MASAVTNAIVATSVAGCFAYHLHEMVPRYLKGLKYEEAASKSFNRLIELQSERKLSK